MTGHICITFTTTILGLQIYEYYSSNSSTSKHTDQTGVITSVCRQSTHVRGPVTASLVTSAIDVSVFVRTAWTCSSAVLCTRFLTSFLRFRCLNQSINQSKHISIAPYVASESEAQLNVTTLFNTDVKIRFRAVTTVSCSAAILCRCCGDVYLPSPRAPGISVYIFSCNCTA